MAGGESAGRTTPATETGAALANSVRLVASATTANREVVVTSRTDQGAGLVTNASNQADSRTPNPAAPQTVQGNANANGLPLVANRTDNTRIESGGGDNPVLIPADDNPKPGKAIDWELLPEPTPVAPADDSSVELVLPDACEACFAGGALVENAEAQPETLPVTFVDESTWAGSSVARAADLALVLGVLYARHTAWPEDERRRRSSLRVTSLN